MSGIVSGLIGGVIALVITTYVAKKVGKSSVSGQLEFGLFMWGLAIACFGFALFPVLITYFAGHDGEIIAKVGLFLGFGTGAVYCFGEAAFVRGTFDAAGIHYSTPWTGVKQEKWQDLVSIEVNDWLSWYTLTFRSGKKVRLSRYLSGHISALEMADEHSTL